VSILVTQYSPATVTPSVQGTLSMNFEPYLNIPDGTQFM